MIKLINWFISSVEDHDTSKLSGRRITAFVFVLLAVYEVIKQSATGKPVDQNIWFGLLGMILLLFGVITWQNIESFRNGKNNGNN